jgi:hypothetical protein
MLEVVTAISLWELIKHGASWITNLKRAKSSRKKESIEALRKVIIVARKTAVYMRQLKDTGQRSHRIESELAVLWTELGFILEDIGIPRLAKRCRIKGMDWAQPGKTDRQYLEKADVGLEKIEQLASEILREIE